MESSDFVIVAQSKATQMSHRTTKHQVLCGSLLKTYMGRIDDASLYAFHSLPAPCVGTFPFLCLVDERQPPSKTHHWTN